VYQVGTNKGIVHRIQHSGHIVQDILKCGRDVSYRRDFFYQFMNICFHITWTHQSTLGKDGGWLPEQARGNKNISV